MKKLVIYDSQSGNTEKIAQAIAQGLDSDTELININTKPTCDLSGSDLIIIGSPTYGGRPKPELQKFLNQLPINALKGKKVAAFDTSFLEKEQPFFLKVLMKIIGYAAPKINAILKNKGGEVIANPVNFYVSSKTGPLRDGELKRAIKWGREINQKI